MSQPYRCPVCEGRTVVPPGFYQASPSLHVDVGDQPCRACGGQGVVWSQSEHFAVGGREKWTIGPAEIGLP